MGLGQECIIRKELLPVNTRHQMPFQPLIGTKVTEFGVPRHQNPLVPLQNIRLSAARPSWTNSDLK